MIAPYSVEVRMRGWGCCESNRNYVSASLQQGAGNTAGDTVRRLPAAAIESVLADTVRRWLPREKQPLDCIKAVRIADDGLILECRSKLSADIAEHLSEAKRIIHSSAKLCRIQPPVAFPLRGGQRLIISSGKPLIAALRRAHSLLKRDRKGMSLIETSPPSPYVRKLLRLAFLAPDIQSGILEGRQPHTLNLQKLVKMGIPICRTAQRKALNWPTAN